MSEPVRLSLPLDKSQLANLKAGQEVRLTGPCYTMRDAGHARALKALEQTGELPFGLAGQTLFYAGPTPAPAGRPRGRGGPPPARTERGDQGAIPSQSPAVTALPEGEPRDCTPHYVAYWHENGAYLYRYAPFTVLRPPIKEGAS